MRSTPIEGTLLAMDFGNTLGRGQRISAEPRERFVEQSLPMSSRSPAVRGARITDTVADDLVEKGMFGNKGTKKMLKSIEQISMKPGSPGRQRATLNRIASSKSSMPVKKRDGQTTAFQRHVWDGRFGLPFQQKGKPERKEIHGSQLKGAAVGGAAGAGAGYALRNKPSMYRDAFGGKLSEGAHIPGSLKKKTVATLAVGGAGIASAVAGQHKRSQIQRRWDATAKTETSKADYYDPEDKRQRRLGTAQGALVAGGGHELFHGAKGTVKASQGRGVVPEFKGGKMPHPTHTNLMAAWVKEKEAHDAIKAAIDGSGGKMLRVPLKSAGRLGAGAAALGGAVAVRRHANSSANSRWY